MPTTTNYGWTTPADTDLVKNGASAIRTLGTAIDTTVFNNASAAIAKTIVDAKGDLIAATAADTVARLPVGTNGQTLVADSAEATGLKWATPSSGGMTLISTTTLSGSSVTLSSIPATYNHLQIVIRNPLPSSSGASINMRFNGDSTANRYASIGWNAGSGTSQTFDLDAAYNSVYDINNSTANGLVLIDIWDYSNTTTWKHSTAHSVNNSSATSTNLVRNTRLHFYNQTAAISSITLLVDFGTFTSGTALLYGVK